MALSDKRGPQKSIRDSGVKPQENLRLKVLSGLRWAAGLRFLGQMVTWLITIVVMRKLSPEDFGLMGMAGVVIIYLTSINELGLGAAIVQRSSLDDKIVRQIFAVLLIINSGLFLLCYLSAPLIASFFNEARLTLLVRVMAIQFIMAAFTIIPQSLIDREMLFQQKSMVEFISAVLGSLTALFLALTGWGVWSLVWGSLSLNIFRTIGLNIVRPCILFPRLSFDKMYQFLSFGGYVTISTILWLFYSQSDVLIVGKLLGKNLLGFYNVAITLAYFPMEKVSGIINQVAFPAFATIQSDPEQAAKHLLKAVRVMCLLVFPTLWGISSVAAQLVDVLIGSKWGASVLPLQIISLVIPVRMISNLMSPALLGLGKTDIELYNVIIYSSVLPLGFFLGSFWGIVGVSLVWATLFPLLFLFNLSRTVRVLKISLCDVISQMIGPMSAAAIMYAAVFFIGPCLTDVHPIARLFLCVIGGAVVYIVLTVIVVRESLQEVWALIRS